MEATFKGCPDASNIKYINTKIPAPKITIASKNVSTVPLKIATTGSARAGSLLYGCLPINLFHKFNIPSIPKPDINSSFVVLSLCTPTLANIVAYILYIKPKVPIIMSATPIINTIPPIRLNWSVSAGSGQYSVYRGA